MIIDGVPFENILLKDQPQEIDVETYFDGLVRADEGVDVNGNVYLSRLNGEDLTGLIKDTMYTHGINTTQVVQGRYILEGDLYVKEMEVDGFVNDKDFEYILSRLILKNRTEPYYIRMQDISFQSGVEIYDLKLKNGSLNGITDKEWGQNWLLTHLDQTVFAGVVFRESIKVDDGIISSSGGIFDNMGHYVDVVKLSKEVIRTDKGGRVGKAIFEETLLVTDKLDLGPDGKINNEDLRKNAILKTCNGTDRLVLQGNRSFLKGFEVYGNLEVDGKIGNVAIQPIIRFLYEKDSIAFQNDSLVVTGDLKLKYEPYIYSWINGKDPRLLMKDVWFTDKDVVLKNRIDFSSPISLTDGGYFANEDGQKVISGLDLSELVQFYASKSKDQEWTGEVTFDTNDLHFGTLKGGELILGQGGTLNGIDVKKFSESILLDGVNQNLNRAYYFDSLHANTIYLAPEVYINDVDVKSDLMTLKGPNKVPTSRIVYYLEANELVLGNDTKLAGINIPEWYRKSVKTYGDYVIDGPLTIQDFYDTQDIRY
jgi:hypothetical protein